LAAGPADISDTFRGAAWPDPPCHIRCHLFLFVLGGWGVHRLGCELGGTRTAKLALLLYCCWPSRILASGLVSKENLTLAAVACGLALFIMACKRQKASFVLPALFSGVAFGLTSLAQPGLLLLALAIPLMTRCWLMPNTWKRIVTLLALPVVGYLVTVAPWQLRNCAVFEGEFCGVATNGGSVFYRANNSLATGAWTPEGATP